MRAYKNPCKHYDSCRLNIGRTFSQQDVRRYMQSLSNISVSCETGSRSALIASRGYYCRCDTTDAQQGSYLTVPVGIVSVEHACNGKCSRFNTNGIYMLLALEAANTTFLSHDVCSPGLSNYQCNRDSSSWVIESSVDACRKSFRQAVLLASHLTGSSCRCRSAFCSFNRLDGLHRRFLWFLISHIRRGTCFASADQPDQIDKGNVSALV